MDKRTLIIIIALILPLVALAFLSQNAKPSNAPPPASMIAKTDSTPISQPPASQPPVTLPATDNNPMSPPQNAGNGRRPPATLDEAKARLRQRLADLEKMNDEQWRAEQRAKRNPSLPPLEPAQERLPDPQQEPATAN